MTFVHSQPTRAAAWPLATALFIANVAACALQPAAAAPLRATAAALAAPVAPWWLAPQLIEGGTGNGIFGFTVAAGDINGDGYADIVSSQQIADDAGVPLSSVVLVYYGSANGPQFPAQVIANPAEADGFDYFGENVAIAGDVNGDGYADVIVDDERGTDPSNPNNFDFRGTVYLFLGSAEGLSPTPAARLVGNDIDGGKFGFGIAGIGDVNGDGYGDIAVGENSVNPAEPESVFVYYGSATGLSEAARTHLTAGTQAGLFGTAVHAAGDVNGDGYADLIVGAPGYQADTHGGGAFIYIGSHDGIQIAPASILVGDTPGGEFGFTVAGVGDLDGDGFDDVMVGTDCEATAAAGCDFFTFPGAAWVFKGTAQGVSQTADAKLLLASDDGTPASFGIHIEPAGDVNGDGIPDVAIGAIQYNGAGSVLVYYGPLSSASQPAAMVSDPNGSSALYAFRFALADVDGDRRFDPIVGAGFYSTDAAPAEGAIYYYPSRDGDRIFGDGFDGTPTP